jgi:tRNA U34 5-carboxymethylaminomethyl modifying GTPase MnmE/TrmE
VSAPGTGAIAVIELVGDVDAALDACGIRRVAVGGVALRDFFGVDDGIVARFTASHALLMPHGGRAVVRGIVEALVGHGLEARATGHGLEAHATYPEARSAREARALAALARAASPLAVDAILSRAASWDDDAEHHLRHLIHAPLVVAVGRPNIGKSSLVNALAQRSVSIVADEPGTTRDHVGVRLDLAGLVVHYVDTPGLRDGQPTDTIEGQAVALALAVAARADLILLCRDAATPFPALPTAVASRLTLRVGLRADLGPAAGVDVAVSARTGEGMAGVVAAVKGALLPAGL